MIFAIAFFLSALAIGFFLAEKTGVFKTFEEKLFAGIPIGIATAAWASYLAYYAFQENGIWVSFAVIICSASFLLWKNFAGKKPELKFDSGFWLRLAPFFFLTALIFANGVPREYEDGSYKVSLAFWADLHHHYASISNFYERVNVPPENPYFSGYPFKYSFIIDLHSADLMKLGLTREIAYWLPAIFLIFSLFALTYILARRLTENKNAAFFAVLLLFFAAGLGFETALHDIAKHPSITDWFLHMDNDYGNFFMGTDEIWVGQILKWSFIPQRANDLGYPLALIVLILLLHAIRDPKKSKLQFLSAGIITGVLPLIREFAFLGIIGVAGVLFLLFRSKKWLWFIIPAALIAIPQVAPILQTAGSTDLVMWNPGWRTQSTDVFKIGAFWLYSFGLPLLLSIAGFFFLKKREEKLLILSLVPLFIIVNLLQFTPDNFNNMKIVLVFIIPVFILAGLALAKTWEHAAKMKWTGNILRMAVILAIIASTVCGFLSFSRDFQAHYVIYSADDVKFADWVNANTGKNGVFMSYGGPHPMDLVGRLRVMGYGGTIWTFGIREWWQRQNDQKDFYAGKNMEEILKRYNVSYVVVTTKERWDLGRNLNLNAIENAAFLEKIFQLPENPNYEVFKVRKTN